MSVHIRPDEIAARETFGHWESDSMIYQKQKTILSVQVERKSRLLRFRRARNKTAEETEHAIRKTVESLPPEFFKTMTFDNGTEGADHRMIRDDYGLQTYFCDPYASWQKGSVENINGIIRRFLPKQKDLSALTDREIYDIQETINNTPRKSLGYFTPNEVVSQYLQSGGALIT
ncbi:IS30 family transposase, partial [Deltaproteobacteria bacterium TL4]